MLAACALRIFAEHPYCCSTGFWEWGKGDGQASAFRRESLLLEGVILVAEGASFQKGQCIAVGDGYVAPEGCLTAAT